MGIRDRVIALACVVMWGVQFVVADVAMRQVGPMLLVALRFAPVAVIALVAVPRPRVSWWWIVAIGLNLGILEFALLFLAMDAGLASGLSSLVMQSSAPFTVLLGVWLLHQRPATVTWVGMAVCVTGLGVVAVTRGGHAPAVALVLALAAGASWALGNICSVKAHTSRPFALSLWSSVVTPVPMFLAAWIFEGPTRTRHSLAALVGPHAWGLWLCLAYLSLFSSALAAGLWTVLLTRHSAHQVAPMSTLVPVIGTLAGHLAFGEPITTGLILGGLIMLTGLALISLSNKPRATQP